MQKKQLINFSCFLLGRGTNIICFIRMDEALAIMVYKYIY